MLQYYVREWTDSTLGAQRMCEDCQCRVELGGHFHMQTHYVETQPHLHVAHDVEMTRGMTS